MGFLTYDDGYIRSDIKLSIGILVSNSIRYIEKCMEGLKPLLDNVKSELIVLDTVGPEKTDGSIDVCRKYTDKIYRFEWINDFAAARNELIKYSKGEWFLYLDDDEQFGDVSELIDFFNGPESLKYNYGSYYVRNQSKGGSYSVALVTRMVRRRPDTHMEGQVHEHFVDVLLPGKIFSLFFDHWGYYYETEEQKRAKVNRNLTLIEKELSEKTAEPGICAQLVQELMNLPERRDEGFDRCVKYCDELSERGYIDHNCVQWMIHYQVRYFHLVGDGEKILEQVDIVRKKYKLSHFAKLAIAVMDAEGISFFLDMVKYAERLKEDVEEYFTQFEYLSDNSKVLLAESQLDFPLFMGADKKNSMAVYGAIACNALKEYDKAWDYWKKADKDFLFLKPEYKADIFETMHGTESYAPLEEYYHELMNPTVFEPGNEKYLPKDLRDKAGFLEESDNLSLDNFMEKVKGLTDEAERAGGAFNDPSLSKLLDEHERAGDIEYYILLFMMAESEIKRFSAQGNNVALDGLIIEYINAERHFYELLYKPASFTGDLIDWLPPECRYNDILYRFVKEEKKDLKKVLEAARIRPDMAKSLSKWIGELEKK